MKTNKIIYWVTSGIFSSFIFLTGISYFIDPKIVGIYKHLGFPDYFRIEIGIAKILGVCALIIPGIPKRIKEFTYAGFSIMLISGCIAHYKSGDPISSMIITAVCFILLVCSFIFWSKLTKEKIPCQNKLQIDSFRAIQQLN